MKKIYLLTITFLTLIISLNANASLITFDLTYEGNSGVLGNGQITFDQDVLPSTGSFANVNANILGITDFSLTITGASVGNGTFGLASIYEWIWVVNTPLDYTQELVGQTGFEDFNWCGFGGCDTSAPRGIGPFRIGTNYAGDNGGGSDPLALVSMKVREVSAPNTLLIVFASLLGLLIRHKKAHT